MKYIKLFESFNVESLKQNVNDILVELGDTTGEYNRFKWKVLGDSKSLRVEITYPRIDDDGNYDEWEEEDFFKLSDIAEYVYMIVDFMEEKIPNVQVEYIATDPVGDAIDIDSLDDETINQIDTKMVEINDVGDKASGICYFGLNFKW